MACKRRTLLLFSPICTEKKELLIKKLSSCNKPLSDSGYNCDSIIDSSYRNVLCFPTFFKVYSETVCLGRNKNKTINLL